MSQQRRLYRDTDNQKLFGVCSGLAEYLQADVTLVRIICLILGFCAFSGVVAYLIMAIVMEPKSVVMKKYPADFPDSNVVNDDPFAKYDKK